MEAWAKDQGIAGSLVQFMADPEAVVTNALGLGLDHGDVTWKLGRRCKRFSMLIDDGVIKSFNLASYADDPAGDNHPEVSCVEKMLLEL